MINRRCLLVINGGSSTVKFAVFEIASLALQISGKVANFEKENGVLEYSTSSMAAPTQIPLNAADQNDCAKAIIRLINESSELIIDAVVHRIVFGMKYSEPQIITSELLAYLETLQAYDPEHPPVKSC